MSVGHLECSRFKRNQDLKLMHHVTGFIHNCPIPYMFLLVLNMSVLSDMHSIYWFTYDSALTIIYRYMRIRKTCNNSIYHMMCSGSDCNHYL